MRYPAWKYTDSRGFVISTLYALPSLYPDEPAVQISGAKAGTTIDQSSCKSRANFKSENIAVMTIALPTMRPLRLNTRSTIKSKRCATSWFGENYVVALNLAPTTPEWLQKLVLNQ
jgi:preprotein translocase subunit SecD